MIMTVTLPLTLRTYYSLYFVVIIIIYGKTINFNLNLNGDIDHSHLPKLLFLLFPFTKWYFLQAGLFLII